MTAPAPARVLRKELRLRDLVQMQILLVVGVTWVGIAARQGGTHLVFWLAAIATFFLPSAAVVGYCSRIWPEEGGVYQWTRHTFGPFAGFLSAWNFGFWALLAVSVVGIQTATSLSYGLGAGAAWMANNHRLITSLNVGLFLLIFLICVPGFGIGKWVSHFGTAVLVLVTLLLTVLLFVHPHSSTAHPHISPQAPFTFRFRLRMLSLLSLNLFSKMAINGLTGLEQIGVFAGETKDPARSIMRSAWLAAPLIALIFILSTGSILTYIPAAQVDLTGPVPQVLAAAFARTNGGVNGTIDWGLVLGRAAIFGLAITVIAQYALIVAETSRLPMVAGWDGLLPEWFTERSSRFGTPIRSIAVIVAVAVGAGLLASSGSGKQEAYQLLTVSSNISYAVYFAMMLLIPLVVGNRFGKPPSLGLKIAAASALVVTALATALNIFPIVDVPHPRAFGAKILGSALLINLAGASLYWKTTRQRKA